MAIDPVITLGNVLITPGVREYCDADVIVPLLLHAHEMANWGDISQADWQENDRAVEMGVGQVLSAYEVGERRIWVITDEDRTVTTVLMPEEN